MPLLTAHSLPFSRSSEFLMVLRTYTFSVPCKPSSEVLRLWSWSQDTLKHYFESRGLGLEY